MKLSFVLGSTALLAASLANLVACSSSSDTPPRRDMLDEASTSPASGNIGNGNSAAATANNAVGAVSTSGGIDVEEIPPDTT